MNPLFFIVALTIWGYILRILRKAELQAWRFLWGSLGLFVLLMVFIQPYVTEPLARGVCAIAGGVGTLTGTYEAYFRYGIVFVDSPSGAITLLVDMECSGVIEIMAFWCLLIFFRVYTRMERVVIGILGFLYIMLSNALRITVICLAVHFLGVEVFHVMHTFVGRILFYLLSVLLYFYVFTKPQVIQMKVGNFTYGHDKKNS